ncbi:MAG: uncharacterized protein KVP18_001680 [Porospora cf. gigantea A]|uniref:uncharacterized protein n=1 Tax=Porospora cf. gigantea A TaxID=2853593 RepID=UPI00355A6174|nr:MAG: hypothetical protein KVP18_001680 [Porospora cf. gigantea A]
MSEVSLRIKGLKCRQAEAQKLWRAGTYAETETPWWEVSTPTHIDPSKVTFDDGSPKVYHYDAYDWSDSESSSSINSKASSPLQPNPCPYPDSDSDSLDMTTTCTTPRASKRPTLVWSVDFEDESTEASTPPVSFMINAPIK